MGAFLLAVCLVAALLAPALVRFFLGNPAVNGMIVVILLAGIAYIFRQVLQLNPQVAWIERYRQMTGEQRLAVALELHEISCEVAREGIRRANPAADVAEVEQLLHRRLELARAE